MALPDGTPLEEMISTLRFLLSRHQSLRTRLRFVDGSGPLQVVSESGAATLDIVDIGPQDDPPVAAEALRSRYEFTPFDHAVEWPVRMGVIRRCGDLTHLVVQYSHVSVDGFGIEAAVRDLAHMDPVTGLATAPAVGLTPLELAARERSPAGQRQSQKSLLYWESILRSIPARRLDDSTDRRDPRFWELVCHSPALYLAMLRVADRTRAETGHVLLAAYAVAMARVTRRSPSVAQVLVNNRFRPGCAESVSQLTQSSLCSIDVADTTFDEVVRRAWKAATKAYLHGYYDTLAHHRLLSRINAERGEEVEISCFVNDRRGDRQPSSHDRLPTAAEVLAARSRTTLRWDRKLPTYDGLFYLHIDPAPDAIAFAIWADTHRLSPAQTMEVARELEAVTVEAALSPSASTGVHASANGGVTRPAR
jgi:hypothetical protein